MSKPGDAEATGSLDVAQAAQAFESLLADDGDNEGGEALGANGPEAEEEAEAPEAEAEPDAESEEGEEPNDGEEQPQTFRVKVADDEVEVTLPELLKGYSREADYTRKTMALGEQARALDADRQQFAATREQTTNLLKALEQTLQAPQYTPEQLDYLRQQNPAEYAAAVADQMARGQHAQTVAQERIRLEQEAAQERDQGFQQRRKEEFGKLIAADSSWNDPKKSEGMFQAARTYAHTLGVTDAELAAMPDHRLLIALHDAAQWRALQAKKPQVQARVEQVRTAKPGTSTAARPGKATEITRARQRLAQTGSVDDAAAVFMHLTS